MKGEVRHTQKSGPGLGSWDLDGEGDGEEAAYKEPRLPGRVGSGSQGGRRKVLTHRNQTRGADDPVGNRLV